MSKGQPVFSWIRKGHFIQSNVLAVHKLGPVEESEKIVNLRPQVARRQGCARAASRRISNSKIYLKQCIIATNSFSYIKI